MAFLAGALALSLLSIPQKAALDADPFAPTGFVVPILFGRLSSLGIAFAILRFHQEQDRRLQPETLVSGAAQLLTCLLGQDIDLEIQLRPDLWPVRMDPTQFEQVLINLALNGRDAMRGKGALKIQSWNVVLDGVSCLICSESVYGDYVRFLVQDEGEGMDATTREQIFAPSPRRRSLAGEPAWGWRPCSKPYSRTRRNSWSTPHPTKARACRSSFPVPRCMQRT